MLDDAWRTLLSDWWTATRTRSYLCSDFSRRKHRHITLSLSLLLGLVLDCFDKPFLIICSEAACILLTALVTRLMPLDSLTADVIVVLAEMAVAVFAVVVRSVDSEHSFDHWGAWENLMCLTIYTLLGVHSSVTTVGSAALAVMYCVLMPNSLFVFTATACLALQIVAGVWIEIVTSSCHLTQMALHKVLDDCSDGFCFIDLETTCIHSASRKMYELFGEVLCGGHFTDMITLSGDKARFEALLSKAKDGSLSTVLVSFEVALPDLIKTFDCKLVAYRKTSAQLGLCLQLIGEVRIERGPDARGGCLTGSGLEQDCLAGQGGEEEAQADFRSPSDAEAPVNDRLLSRPVSVLSAFDNASGGVPSRKPIRHPEADVASVAAQSTTELAYSISVLSAHENNMHIASTQTPIISTSSSSTQTNLASNSLRPPRLSEKRFPDSSPSKNTNKQNRKEPERAHIPKGRVNLCSSKLVHSQFVETPVPDIQNFITSVLLHVNPRGSGCCAFHIGRHVFVW